MLVLLPAELGVPLVSGATQLLQVTGLCVCACVGWGGWWGCAHVRACVCVRAWGGGVGGGVHTCVHVCVYHCD